MIDSFAKRIVFWQMRKKYLSGKDEKMYIYAYGLLIGQAINIIIACLLAIIFNAYITVFIFLAFYIPLRTYAGGYHARTYDMCTLASAVLICIVCFISKMIPYNFILGTNLTIGVISGILIFALAPIEDCNKPLEYTERDCYRRRSRVIWIVETVIWMICYWMKAENISLAISLGHFALSIMLCLGNKHCEKRT